MTRPQYGSKTGQANDGFNLDITLESQVAPPAEVIMKTGIDINTALKNLGADSALNKTFTASPTPPAAGTVTELLSDAGSPTEVLAWLDADGISIKYYAAGYTDTGTKIPLNADSSSMFKRCYKLTSIDVSGFSTDNIISMESIFLSCQGLTSLDLSSWNTNGVTNMSGMFEGCDHLTTIYVSAGFVTTNVTTDTYMFYNNMQLKGGGSPQTAYSNAHTDKTYACIDDPANGAPGYFTRKP